MIAIVTLLLALPLGYLLRSRSAACTTYVLAYLWAFTFQSVYLVLDAVAGAADPAFTPGSPPVSYGAVTLVVLAVGLLLVEAGHRLAARRRAGAEPAPA